MEAYSPERVIHAGNTIIDFNNRSLDEYLKTSNEDTRERLNLESYKRFKELVLRRINDGIIVSKIHRSHRLIISDNPVISSDHIYNPASFIRLPLDVNHIVTLVPYTKEDWFNNKAIARMKLDEQTSYFQSTVFNHMQVDISERFLLGRKSDLEKVLDELKHLNQQKSKEECETHANQLNEKLAALQSKLK